MGPLLFLIDINDIPNELTSNAKLFVDDIPLFTIVKDKNESANNDLSSRKIINNSKWVFSWKMLPTISLNNIQVERASYQKHFGILVFYSMKNLISGNILILLF